MYHDQTRAIYDLNRFTCYFTDFFLNTLDSFCVLTTLILSIDRFYAIWCPIKLRQFVTNRCPKRLTLICFLLLTFLYLPEVFLSYRKYVIIDKKDNNTPNTPNANTYANKNRSFALAESLTNSNMNMSQLRWNVLNVYNNRKFLLEKKLNSIQIENELNNKNNRSSKSKSSWNSSSRVSKRMIKIKINKSPR